MQDMIVSKLRRIPGVKLAAPQGAFYVLPEMSAFFGPGDGVGDVDDQLWMVDDDRDALMGMGMGISRAPPVLAPPSRLLPVGCAGAEAKGWGPVPDSDAMCRYLIERANVSACVCVPLLSFSCLLLLCSSAMHTAVTRGGVNVVTPL